jgi:ubiquinone/menaquinone biosynthesis C-methylase UbiE
MLLRAQRKRWAGEVRWLLGDAMDPAAAGAEGPYDGILMAYGIRNVADADTCLANLFDLLAPGGTICFHEYSVADSLRSRALWNFVAGAVIIPAGVVTSPGSPIYRYLRRSVVEFDGVKAFESRLRRAGFTEVRTLPMDGWQRGIVHSFLAERPR